MELALVWWYTNVYLQIMAVLTILHWTAEQNRNKDDEIWIAFWKNQTEFTAMNILNAQSQTWDLLPTVHGVRMQWDLVSALAGYQFVCKPVGHMKINNNTLTQSYCTTERYIWNNKKQHPANDKQKSFCVVLWGLRVHAKPNLWGQSRNAS